MANYHNNNHHNNNHNYHNNHNSQGGHSNHHGRPHNSNRSSHNHSQNREEREHRENREGRENRENREGRENRSNRDNQVINSFILGTKELDDKTAEFQYDKGWYSITDIMGEEKNVIYRSKNAQEAYTKWNVYIGRKKERSHKNEKAD